MISISSDSPSSSSTGSEIYAKNICGGKASIDKSSVMPSGQYILLTTIMLLLTLSLSALLVSAAPTKRQAPCEDVHIFLARGWNEQYPGRQGKLTGAICYGLPSCGYEDILYSSLPTDDYCASVAQGSQAGIDQMTAYAARCPNSKLVLSGYSQGANVAGNILAGGGGPFGTPPNNCVIAPNVGLDPTTSPGNKSKTSIWLQRELS